MLVLSNLVKVSLRNGAAICLAIVCAVCFILPALAQPTSFRNYSPETRKRMTQETLLEVAGLTAQIKKDSRNPALYNERLRFYGKLLELNFDNGERQIYADRYEADLSRIIEIERTAENFIRRGDFLSEELRLAAPPEKFTELYPSNRYVDRAASDYMEALRLRSNARATENIYTALGYLYSSRPQKLVSTPNFPKWRNEIQLKLVFDDFAASIKYARQALEIGNKSTHADVLRGNLMAAYMIDADSAVKLEAYQTALELYEEGQNYFSEATSQCAYYAAWGNVYLKLKKFDEAIKKLNAVPKTIDAFCVDLFAGRGDALTAKGEFRQALSDYDKALTLDRGDSLQRIGWVHIKRAKLFLQTGKAEQALDELSAAAEKKYIAGCPLVYQTRASVYRKLGKPDLAAIDLQTAGKLQNQASCRSE